MIGVIGSPRRRPAVTTTTSTAPPTTTTTTTEVPVIDLPPHPNGVQPTVVSDTWATFTWWADPVITSYLGRLRTSTDEGATWTVARDWWQFTAPGRGTLDTVPTWWHLDGLTPSTQYQLDLRGVDSSGNQSLLMMLQQPGFTTPASGGSAPAMASTVLDMATPTATSIALPQSVTDYQMEFDVADFLSNEVRLGYPGHVFSSQGLTGWHSGTAVYSWGWGWGIPLHAGRVVVIVKGNTWTLYGPAGFQTFTGTNEALNGPVRTAVTITIPSQISNLKVGVPT